MVQFFILGLALAVGHTDDSSSEVAPEAAGTTAPERWALMQAMQGTYYGWFFDGNGIQVNGWTNFSYTASSAAQDNLPLGLNYRANEFLLQQNWLHIEKAALRNDHVDPTFGFCLDTILPGSDYRFTLPRGLFNAQLTANNGGPNNYGIDPVQMYVEAYFPTISQGLDLKIGRMYCQFGAESTPAVANSLPSHSYTFFYNPFTQVGAMATQQLTSTWSIQYGAMIGPDVFFDAADSPYGCWSIKWAPPGGPDTVLVSALMGSGRYNVPEQFNNPNIIDLVYTHAFDSTLNYTLDALFGYQNNVPDTGTALWFGIVNYLTKTLSPRLNGTTRLEFFDDVDGNRTGYPGLYTAITAGLRFQARPGIILRPELRFDYNNESQPFEGKHGLATATTDVIVRW